MLTRRLATNFRWLKYRKYSTNAQEPGKVRAKIDQYVDVYEEFIGVKTVRQAQEEVMKWEKRLSEAQLVRREKQAEINNIQSRLKEIHFDLDRTSRGEDKYLQLLTEEHQIIKKERQLLNSFEGLETAEREAFHQLSMRVRASHERERERAEKTKWWGVSASLLGALLGIAGTSIGNELRMRKIKEMLPIGGAQMSEMAKAIGDQNEKVAVFLSEMRKALQVEGTNSDTLSQSDVKKVSDIDKLLTAIREENARLSQEMRELSRLAQLEAALDADPTAVVYVGSDMERLLEQTEKNIESKMKLRTLLTVVVIYTAVAVTAPWLYAVFRGD
uniref:Coiled-coil domain-containing protein 51 n=1 Tax=Caenorhabditis tropicalis TaxID=1561998 RepID=A0A1I7V082_9PELO